MSKQMEKWRICLVFDSHNCVTTEGSTTDPLNLSWEIEINLSQAGWETHVLGMPSS